MKSMKLFMVAAAATMMLASCDKAAQNTPDEGNGASKSVTISFTDPGTRASQTAYTTSGTLVAKAADLFALFADADGEVIQIVDLGDAVTTAPEDETKFWFKATTGGFAFHVLPDEVRRIAVTNLTAAKGDDLDDLAKTSFKIDALSEFDAEAIEDWQTGNQDVPVWGESIAANWKDLGTHRHPETGLSYQYFDAGKITVNSLLSRIEIGGISADLTADKEGEVVRFTALGLEAIGLYYGPITGTGYVTEEEWLALGEWQKDTFAAGTVLTAAAPDYTGVFGYNVNPGSVVPNIALQIGKTGTTVKDGLNIANFALPYYARTKELQTLQGEAGSQAMAKLTNLEAGKLYKVTYAFADSDIRPWEFAPEICVDVAVTIQPWGVAVEVTPIFND